MAATLTVHCGDQDFLLDPATTPEVTIGRGSTCTIRLDYSWLSRTHLRLSIDDGQWVITDASRNGTFRDGVPLVSAPVGTGVTLHLGNPEGLPITFTPAGQPGAATTTASPGDRDPGDDLETTTSGAIDPGIARAGAAVAARRRQLDITQRSLARDKIINASSLISFEKGRSWPHKSTRTALETILKWPPGTIDALREGSLAVAEEEATTVIAATGGAPLIVGTIKLALQTIDTAIAALPDPASPAFLPAADAVLAHLADLRRLTEESARSTATPSAEISHLMIGLRRRSDEIMARTADCPAAPPGRRLYGRRRRAGLTAEDVAVIARLPVETIHAAEAGQPLSPAQDGAITRLLSELTGA